MARTVKPGLLFQAGVIPTAAPSGGLEPTMSTYQYGASLEGAPRTNTTYVVCQDMSIQDFYEPGRPIGWELLEDETGWYYRVTQMNHKPKPVALYFRGMLDPVPVGGGRIGSIVTFERRVIDEPQAAEIREQKDEGPEVSSPEPTPRAEPVCPGAPRKLARDLADIAAMNADLAGAAEYLNDPVQTAAMARFARGEMSYAEMRGLCG